jgi:hypothetical protein
MRRTTIAVAFLCTTSVWADCPNGVYDFTDADKKFMTDTAAVLQASVPPAPEGWSLRDAAGRAIRPGAVWTPPSSSCAGAEGRPLVVAHDVKYFWVTGEKDIVQKQNGIRKKMAAVQHTPMAADQEKLAKELAIKDRDLRYQARKFERTDKAEADRLKAEAAVYRKQHDEIQQAHYATLKPQLDALQKEEDDVLRGGDLLEVKFRIFVNSTGVDSRDLKPFNPQAGAATTLSDAKRTLLLYGGAWKKDTNGSLLGAFQPGAKIQKVYNIYVEAQGDPKQTEAILSKMDGAGPNALLGK